LGSWSFSGTSGICHNSVPGLSQHNAASPFGANVAFLVGQDTVTVTTAPVISGLWRLTFVAAQRHWPTMTDTQAIRITVAGVEVFEKQLVQVTGAPYELCTTRPFELLAAQPIVITGLHAGQVLLFDQFQMEPVADWNNGSAWTAGPPSGTPAMIPAGVVMGVRGTATADSLLVNGELLALPAPTPSSLAARWIMVQGPSARLEIGQPDTPFETQFEILLTGDDVGLNVMGMAGGKVLGATDDGVIDLHGLNKAIDIGNGHARTWTRLAAHAAPTNTSITVAEPVNWGVGDEIVITSSFAPYLSGLLPPASPGHGMETEVRRIASVSVTGNGTVINLQQPNAPLSFQHFGGGITSYSNASQTWVVDRSAEVGLLTHNVKVRGVLGTDPQFGGHVMIMRDPMTGRGGVARLANVELRDMGQVSRLGRYPMHWHMMLNQSAGQYIKHCSVVHSFNRAITVHGSESVVVEGNVAYDHIGHGMFLEDGSETNNKFWYNLALKTNRATAPPPVAVLPTDFAPSNTFQNNGPATYWISNPNNLYVGNVAADSVGTGFWFVFPPSTPTGMSETEPYFQNLQPPNQTPLARFEDNVCHGLQNAFDVNDSIFYHDPNPNNPDHSLRENFGWRPQVGGQPAPPQAFVNTTVYACYNGMYISGGPSRQIEFVNSVFEDNLAYGFLANAGTVVRDSLFVRRADPLFRPVACYATGFYDGMFYVQNCHFVNFDQSAPLIGVPGFQVAEWGVMSNWGGNIRNVSQQFQGITSTGTNGGTLFWQLLDMSLSTDGRDFSTAIVDVDGSMTGLAPTPGPYSIVGNHPIMQTVTQLPINGQYAAATQFRWATLSVLFPYLHCQTAFPLHPNGYPASIAFVRQLVEPGLPPSTVWHVDSNHSVDQRRKCPVIVQPPSAPLPFVNYDIAWTTPLPTTAHDVWVELISLDDQPVGTSTMIALHSLPALPTAVYVQTFDRSNSAWDAPVQRQMAPDLWTLFNSQQTEWFISGVPFIRFVSTPNKSGIRVLVTF